MYVYLQDILREFVKNDDEILIDLEPLKEFIFPSIVIKTHPVFYVLQDACTSDTYDQQLMNNFKGTYRFTNFFHNMFKMWFFFYFLSESYFRIILL